MTDIVRDLQKQNPGSSLIVLYELEMPDGVTTWYFHDGKNANTSQNITFDGNTYECIPVQFDGVDITSDGPGSRPTLIIGNVLTVFKDALGAGYTYEDLLGRKFTRRRTLSAYLTSSPAVELPKDIFYVDRIASTSILSVSIELASPFDIEGIKLPARTIIGGGCSWQYQGASSGLSESQKVGGCTWNRFSSISIPGGSDYTNYVNSNDEPVVPIAAVVGAWAGSGSVNSIYSTDQDGLTRINKDRTFTTGVTGKNYWQMVKASPGTPSDTNPAWRRVRVYSSYSSSGTYTVFTDPSYNSYVTYNYDGGTRLFKKIYATQGSTSEGSTPAYNKFWELGDVCGKRLFSCTRRFQYRPATSSGQPVPSTDYNQEIILPFGGFPGSRSYN
jgi:lambda family phage minor tail protein L